MKNLKILLLASVLAVSFTLPSNKAEAQRVETKTFTDSITNAGTSYTTFSAIPDGYSVTVSAIVTKISGTAGGSVTPQATIDGTNWFNCGTAYTITDVASQVTSWTFAITAVPGIKLRLKGTGTGTMVATLKGSQLLRKSY